LNSSLTCRLQRLLKRYGSFINPAKLCKLVSNVLENRSNNFSYFLTHDTLGLVNDIGNHLLRRCVGRNPTQNALQEWHTRQFPNQFNT
jgi:hypothetical protein